MRPQSLDRLKALLLILMAIFFADRLVSGQLYYYIGPRFSWLSLLSIALFIILAGAYNPVARRHGEGDQDHAPHAHGEASIVSLLIVSLPLVLGILIPPSPLGASAVAAHSTTGTAATYRGSQQALTIVPTERNLLDWVRVMNADPDPSALNGQEAEVIGFVYRDDRFDKEQFLLARFTLTCCMADAMAIGVVVQSPQAQGLSTDSWVRVQGVFAEGVVGSEPSPVLVAEDIAPVQQPEQPYLYP